MIRVIFSQKIVSAGQNFEETRPPGDNKTEEEIPTVGLAIMQSFAVVDLWKIRISQGYVGNSTSAL